MSIKAIAAKLFAKKIVRKTQEWAQNPIATQEAVFKKLNIFASFPSLHFTCLSKSNIGN